MTVGTLNLLCNQSNIDYTCITSPSVGQMQRGLNTTVISQLPLSELINTD